MVPPTDNKKSNFENKKNKNIYDALSIYYGKINGQVFVSCHHFFVQYDHEILIDSNEILLLFFLNVYI